MKQFYLTFMCGSECFGRLSAHHQEFTTALWSSGFTVGVLLVVVWQTTTNNAPTTTPLRWLSHRSGRQPKRYIKPEAAITVFELLMMGGVSPETC